MRAASCRTVGPKITVPFAGFCRSAVWQSVGAGCCAGETPSIQIRHLPVGGIKCDGTTGGGGTRRSWAAKGAADAETSASDTTKRRAGKEGVFGVI